ncbi:SusE domain-containing protein [Fibrella aquatica]|uniref:SusE domain-containing protein n=1 Tax=Fibrella aquatica TaxID=3242487 RepID=UPI003522B277
MKQTFLSILCLCLAGILMQCKDAGRDINTNISDVTSFFSPNDNQSIKLLPATPATVVFEWDQARAEDGTLVLYELAFDNENGDFSKPIYKLASDQNGVMNKATVTHATLNRVAALAGIGSLGQGKLKWTVQASRGINVKQATQSRVLNVERPAGFAEVPAEVYLTGDATEAGTDLTKAIKLKSTSSGVFEVYTSLKSGTYSFVDRTTGTAKSFNVDGTNIGENGTTTVTGPTKTYRIVLDFNNAAARVTEIKSVGLWVAGDNAVRTTLPYVGGGVWMIPNYKVEFVQFSWGRDERYKFRLTTVGADGKDAYEWLGSSNADNSRADANTPASYFFLLPIGESQWDYTYKFNGAVDNKNADIMVSLSPTGPYTHRVTIK